MGGHKINHKGYHQLHHYSASSGSNGGGTPQPQEVLRIFTQETNLDTEDRHYFQGYQTFLGVSTSDSVNAVSFRACIDNGLFQFTNIADLNALKAWYDSNVVSTRLGGTKSIIEAVIAYKAGRGNELAIVRLYVTENT